MDDRSASPQGERKQGLQPEQGSAKVHGDKLEPLIPRDADQKSEQDRTPRQADESARSSESR